MLSHSTVRTLLLRLIVAVAALLPAAALAASSEAKIELEFSSSDYLFLYISLGLAVLAIVVGAAFARWTMQRPAGSEKMQEISAAIKQGALAYLRRQVKTMSVFVVVVAISLYVIFLYRFGPITVDVLGLSLAFWQPMALWLSLAFVLGVAASYIAGYTGMMMAVNANARVANAARTSYKNALEIAFRAGAVAGLITVGMGLLGATLIFLLAGAQAMQLLIGFGLGGSLAALFMRVGGGIFTKSADVGADLVGKVEEGLPEDDPRNAATIADLVGDNVGDCAGMAADIFESYEVTLVAAIILGAATAAIFPADIWMKLILFALMARGVGVVASIIGVFFVRGRDDAAMDPLTPIRKGFWASAAIAVVATFGLAYWMMQDIEVEYYEDYSGEQYNGLERLASRDVSLMGRINQIEEAEEINRRAREQAGPPVGGQLQPAPGPTGGVGEGTEPGEGEPRAEAGEGGGQEGDTPSSGDPSGLDGAGDEPEFQQVQLSADGDAEVSDLLDDEEMANRINESLQAEFEVLKELGSTPPPEPVEVTHQDVARLRAHELRNFTVIEQNLARGSLVRAIGPVFGEGPVFVKDTISLPPGPGEDGPREIETWSLTSEGQLNRAPGITVLDEDKIPVSLAMGAEGGLFWVLEASDPAVLLFLPSFDYTRAKHEPVDQVTFENFGRVNPDGRSVAVTTKGNTVPWYLFAIAITFGVLMAYVIELLTDYFVSFKKKPVREVAAASTAGPAPMIIQGFAYGMESSVWAVVAIVVALLAPLFIFPPGEYGGFILSFYGIALVGLGLLTTTGFILAMDTFGPISDNAQGVYEMSGAAKDEKTEEGSMPGSRAVQQLDAAGNTTKALTKGFAIATAVVAAVALYHSYIGDTKLTGIGLPLDLPQIFLGLLIGGAAPFLFCAFMVNAVGRGSFELIGEVRRQFKADPGIMAGTSKPDYAKCVEIVTGHAQKELLGPAILAIALPALVAFGLAIGHEPVIIRGVAYNLTGAQALGGFLAGAILSSQLLAVTLFNSGGIWDNAKKTIEDGMYGGKGSEAHKAGVVVDTVGDPFKDTAGPALNPLIKVMNLVALLMAPVVILDISDTVRYVIVACSVAALAVAVIWSKRGSLGAELQKTAGGE